MIMYGTGFILKAEPESEKFQPGFLDPAKRVLLYESYTSRFDYVFIFSSQNKCIIQRCCRRSAILRL